MASTQEFRKRIKSVNSTSQITKAMEMVASVKMQRAQKAILSARSYVQNSWNLLTLLKKLSSPEDHPLLSAPEKVDKTCIILVTSDRGLCGSFNAELIRKISSFLNNHSTRSKSANETGLNFSVDNLGKIDFVTVGKRALNFAKNSQKGDLVAEFSGFDNGVEYKGTTPISKIAMDDFLANKYQKVLIVYSHFKSSLEQIPVIKQVLPITENHIDNLEVWEANLDDEQAKIGFKFEPSADLVMEKIIPLFIRLQIFGAILESNASEHSARMIAMKNATDNAKELIDELTLTYNTVRQNSITSEIAEISAGAEAMR